MAKSENMATIEIIERNGEKYLLGHCSKPECDQYTQRKFESMKDTDAMLDWKRQHPWECGKFPQSRLNQSRN